VVTVNDEDNERKKKINKKINKKKINPLREE